MELNEQDSAFAADSQVDQELSWRTRGRRHDPHRRSSKSGQSSPDADSLAEEAPLLGEEAGRSGGAEDNKSDAEVEWFGTAELQSLPWWRRPSIFWLIPPYLLYTTAFGGIIVPKLNLIMNLICNDYYASNSPSNPDPISGPVDPGNEFDRCQNSAVSARASMFILYASLISGVLAAITSPKLGALSDRYGRKPILVVTTFGVLMGEVLTILAAKFPETTDVNWILAGYGIDGLCGSFIVGMAVSHSYATDCTPPQRRNVAFGYFHACLFSGIALGPVLAGYLIKYREPVVGKMEAVLLVFYIALACHVLFILLLIFVIPESVTKTRQLEARRKYAQEKARRGPNSDWINQLRSFNLIAPLKILWPTGPGTSPALRRNLILLAATDTIVFGVSMGAMGVITIYVRLQFGWQEWETSKYVSIVNSCRVFSLVVGLPLLTRLVRGRNGTKNQRNSGSDTFDLSLIRLAILFDMLGFLGYSLARRGDLFIASGAIAAVGGIGSPTLGSSLTKHVPPDRVGQVLGATGLLHAIARVVGPTVFNGIYSATVGSFRQATFVCLTGTFGVAFLCGWLVRPHVYLEDLAPDGSPSRSESDGGGGEEGEFGVAAAA
ncbi:tetracycline-efflux transporter-like protein [Westerdykella ornata]|uniref:Tetracycline-efflux transporter-like protein n=1 Tax=Westerdykella ornata TaxID=318751 RepID=A0A6A6JMZ4_WESOR|nr:tetracycline-efflux transporter-like protein [Westerdykella ornata]KAF2277971.1 tetracycline-efflux transporter-like protein [Westerdykella ornata]